MVASITPANVTLETFLPEGSPPLVENQMSSAYGDHEIIHAMPYGDPGSEKSTFAATFPKPMVVLFFDPFAKAGPYRRRGTKFQDSVSRRNPHGLIYSDRYQCNFEFIMSRKEEGRAATVIIHLTDTDIRAGVQGIYAAEKFEHVWLHLGPLLDDGVFDTVAESTLPSPW